MSFEVAADSYQRFMGRYADALAARFLDDIAPRPGQRALDVGAGTGALTAALVSRLGTDAVAAIEPSSTFAGALRERLPGVDVREASAESIPFPDAAFDLALAQLVVHFMADPVAGIREMARVTMPGGLVGASVWDFGGDRSPHSILWRAAREVDPSVDDESGRPGARAGHLAELFSAAGLRDVDAGELTVAMPYADFASWWEPYLLGVGPAGAFLAGLSPDALERVRARCEELLPPGPGVIEATVWTALGTV